MGQSYQIGESRVEITDQGVVATLAVQRGARRAHPAGFVQGVHALRGTWIGDRIAFQRDQADRVLDLFRTHFETLDPTGLSPTRLPVSRVVRSPGTLLPENASELDRLRSNLPILEQRERTLRQRHESALRALDLVRARIAVLDLDETGS